MIHKARAIFYVSDGTGITAETIGHSVLTQFDGIPFQTRRLPFVDNEAKARIAAGEIRRIGDETGFRPVVINTVVDGHLSSLIAESGALMLDVFAPFIPPLENALGRERGLLSDALPGVETSIGYLYWEMISRSSGRNFCDL